MGHSRRRLLPSWVAATALVAGFAVTACEDDPVRADPDESLAEGLERVRTGVGVPALGAVLFTGDEVLEADVVGVRVAGRPERARSDDRWHAGSLTKAMTATLAGVLVEDGSISWETTVLDVFPEWEGEILPAYHDVRLEELLSHTGGVMDDVTRTPSWPELRDDPDPLPEQRVRWSREFLSVAPEATRGTYLYSNAGYVVAGALLEGATGRSWEELLSTEVWGPLSMAGAGFGAPGRNDPEDALWGHRVGAGGWRGVSPGPLADNPPALGPAGTVHGRMDDLVRFAQAHLRGARGEEGLLRAETWARMHSPPPTSRGYALGWARTTRPWAPGPVFFHHGSNGLWHASVWIAPEADFGLVTVTNAGGDDGFQAADQAAGLLIERFGRR